jgi:bifunctional non-homologous end joining protein LigD
VRTALEEVNSSPGPFESPEFLECMAKSKSPLPKHYQPQLATLVKTVPEGDAWLHEIKYDGYRIGCLINRGAVTLTSRNAKDWTASFSRDS